MICDRCGRLLNRATGRCVCADYGGAPPPPVATSHPITVAAPAAASAAAAETAAPVAAPAAPISTAAAIAALDLSDRPARPVRTEPVEPAAPLEPPRAAGAPAGVIRGARAGRRRVDAVAYDGILVLASRGASGQLAATQLAAQDAASRLLDANLVDDVDVREDALSGKATIRLRNGEVVVLSWPARKNKGTSAETLLAHSFPGKVDQGSAEVARRAVRAMAIAGALMLVAGGAWAGLSVLLRQEPPPPPPPAAAPALAPAEQAARAELQAACPPWQAFAASVKPGDRPDPVQLRPVVDGIRGRFDAAAAAGADPSYAAARDEVGYLQDYGRRTPEAAGQESVSRLAWAMRSVSAACTRAASGP